MRQRQRKRAPVRVVQSLAAVLGPLDTRRIHSCRARRSCCRRIAAHTNDCIPVTPLPQSPRLLKDSMSTAVAAAPPTTSLASAVDRHVSPRQYASITTAAPSALPSAERVEPAPKRARSNGSPSSAEIHQIVVERSNSNGKSSPTSCVYRQHSRATKPGTDFALSSRQNVLPPMIKVKKEPGSPPMSSSRPRPKRLDLSSSTPNSRGPQTARPSAPLTSRESAGLQVQDVGLACLSPGFQTNDPGMREQLQRSLDVRDQQRQIIEARQKGTKPGSAHDSDAPRTQDTTLFGVQTRTPTTSRRKGPPPGLSIAAPSAAQFANDRVIQSAPLHQTFTGLRPGDPTFTRHAQHGPSGLSQMSHIHHVPATQTNNRLPPIADVFANDRLEMRGQLPLQSPSHPNGIPPVPSPGFPPQPQQMPGSARFRSADEAVAGLSGGRDDLMPKVVHYGGVQPPTPPSPMNVEHTSGGSRQPYHPDSDRRPDILARTSSMNGRRRGREEFERDNGSPPSTFNHQEPKRATFAVRGEAMDEDWRAGMSSAEKKEEFLRLCERAWDLFHS